MLSLNKMAESSTMLYHINWWLWIVPKLSLKRYNPLTYFYSTVPAIKRYPIRKEKTMNLLLNLVFSLFAFMTCFHYFHYLAICQWLYLCFGLSYYKIMLLLAPLPCQYITLEILSYSITFFVPQKWRGNKSFLKL